MKASLSETVYCGLQESTILNWYDDILIRETACPMDWAAGNRCNHGHNNNSFCNKPFGPIRLPMELNVEITGFVYTASTWIIPVLLAITLHEAAHAYAAWQLGDNTAYNLGRVTINPIKHMDLFGTVLLPALLLITKAPFLFGWAKPVPVAFARLRRPRRDMVLVAAAGPGTNLILAAVSAALFRVIWLVPEVALQWSGQMLYNSILLNLILAVFNMLPLPPLDGGRVAVGLLPGVLSRPLARLERHGMLILIVIIFILPMLGDKLGINLDIFKWAVWAPVNWLLPFFKGIAGIG